MLNRSIAFCSSETLALAALTFASLVEVMNCGTIVAARIPRMTTTTSSSRSVNPWRRRFCERKKTVVDLDVFMEILFLVNGPAHLENGEQEREDHKAHQRSH